MTILQFIAALACLIIIGVSLWAHLSPTVRDRAPLKFSLALVTISAWLVMMHMNERTYSLLAISIGFVVLTACYQRFIQQSRLFYREYARSA